MQYVNSIPLNSTITIFTPSGSPNIYNQYTYVVTTANAAIFKKTQHSRDNFQRETKYNYVVITKDAIDKDAYIYIGTTAETDPLELGSFEIQDFSPMEDVQQTVIGYKLWL